MFKIINVLNDSSENILAPHFVRLNPSNTWVHCGESDAQAIALHAKLYRLINRDGNSFYVEPYDQDDRLRAVADINKQRSDDLIGAVFDLDLLREDIISALFDLDKRLEAISNG